MIDVARVFSSAALPQAFLAQPLDVVAFHSAKRVEITRLSGTEAGPRSQEYRTSFARSDSKRRALSRLAGHASPSRRRLAGFRRSSHGFHRRLWLRMARHDRSRMSRLSHVVRRGLRATAYLRWTSTARSPSCRGRLSACLAEFFDVAADAVQGSLCSASRVNRRCPAPEAAEGARGRSRSGFPRISSAQPHHSRTVTVADHSRVLTAFPYA